MISTRKPFAVFLSGLITITGAILISQSALGQDETEQPVAGKADVLRHVQKKFATLVGVDVQNLQVELQIEGQDESRVWHVNADAELKIHGWWGRLADFETGDRVWVWLDVDRKKQPKSVLMLADEISEQDIHALPHTVKSLEAGNGSITVESEASGERTLRLARDLSVPVLAGSTVFIQSVGDMARIVATEDQLESMRQLQKERLRKRWRATGLPGTVVFLHPLGGEMDVILDHEAIRWGRYLKTRDKVTLTTEEPIDAVVKHVRPWRERTQVRLVTNSGVDQADLSIGQRIALRVPEPPPEVQSSDLPTDIGRLKSEQERIEWFLASTYCSCKIAGDRCTGMFYTLASCNENACGMPNQIRGQVRKMLDEGMSDEETWHGLRDQRGGQVAKQHLLR